MLSEIKPHLAELRKRLSLSAAAVIVAFIIAFVFHNPILTWITAPLNEALVEVGRIVNIQEKAEWHLDPVESNVTNESNATLEKNVTVIKKPAYLQPESAEEAAALKLEIALEKATKVAEKELAFFLIEATQAAKELRETLKGLNQNIDQASFDGQITTHQVGGAFFVALKVSFFAGLLGALPFVLYQLWLFIAPGLYENEKKMVTPFVLGGSFMFAVGVLFAYYVVTPFGFQFLITFGSFLYTPLINIEDYVGFFTKIMMGFGIAFELPVVAYFLAVLGMVTDKTLKDFFKYAVIIIFGLAALLTPPDVLTQLLMAIPLILLYGLSIIIVKYVNPHVEDEDDEENPDEEQEEKQLLANKK
ncbi:MAG: Twin-arginine translocation protein TatC [uncultured Sulfurovum sp.]|uniref:Sec-independent protein translocase protein TatC n=1 Tax=uncultured Sulfurovum sp. TaxID=269237 RepID=A0A6S6S3I9_9BACT|nr:MAG: Twin-arginine translocation protein TatC [uncultured Sulfurovum sp.]